MSKYTLGMKIDYVWAFYAIEMCIVFAWKWTAYECYMDIICNIIFAPVRSS